MSQTTVKYGWVIQDQASVVHGMSFGPNWLKGRQRTGPVFGGDHNLIGKDIVFYGKGKYALGAVVDQMYKMGSVRIRAGIYPGMTVEKFVESEYGGGMDQIRTTATREDISRVTYYLYAFPYERSAYEFSSLATSLASQAVGFIPANGTVLGVNFRELFEAGATATQKVRSAIPQSRTELGRALRADEVMVVLTAKQRPGRTALASHSHTHSMPTLARDISRAVLAHK